MRYCDITSLLVYFVQLLLAVPCIWLVLPLAPWLTNQHHWPTWVAVAGSVLLMMVGWLALIAFFPAVLSRVLRRRARFQSGPIMSAASRSGLEEKSRRQDGGDDKGVGGLKGH